MDLEAARATGRDPGAGRPGPRQSGLVSSAARLSDADLLRRLTILAAREREATAELVAHLAELDARKLHLAEGFGSLFSYCTGALRLAEHAAYNRIEAARASRRFPAILDLLVDGSLNLSTVRLLAPHLRPDNFEPLVAMAKGRSKREVEALVARLAPRPDVAASVRKLPAPLQSATVPPPQVPVAVVQAAAAHSALTSADQEPAPRNPAAPGPEPTTLTNPLDTQADVPPATFRVPAGDFPGFLSTPTAAVASERPAQRPVITPLAPERYRVQFTVGEATHAKLRRVQSLLRREIPDGDPGAIFDRALTLLLEDVARRQVAATSSPRSGAAAGTRSRHVPARVRRHVWLRDEGRCAFVAPSGRRCGERAFLEFHHRVPYGVGGEATAANISLRCRSHNVYEGELAFGPRACIGRAASVGSRAPSGRSPNGQHHGAVRHNSPRGEWDTP
jgi:hypothetical protein